MPQPFELNSIEKEIHCAARTGGGFNLDANLFRVLTNARRSPYVGNLDFSITTVLLLAFSFVFGLSFCA